MRFLRGTALLCFALVTASAEGAPPEPGSVQRGAISVSLANEAQAAIDRGLAWLLARQDEGGHWSNREFPALTAFPVWSLARGGYARSPAVRNAVEYMLDSVHENGAIYREPSEARKGGGLKNYNTAICMIALHEVGAPSLVPVVLKARRYMARAQHLGGDVYRGGMGYDPDTGRAYADLSNSYIGFEAMRLTEDAEDLRPDGSPKADLDWQAAREFVERVHNDPKVNKASWVTEDPEDQGGFAYHPEQTRADTYATEEGTVKFHSFGSMTYAGMLSYIYAEVDRDDYRVRSTVQWAARHWTLEENPGTGQEGLFYFYNVLSKGLAAYGSDYLQRPNGRLINWRTELVEKVLGLQKLDEQGRGYWVNEVGRYWENDPVLVTSYCLLALQVALQ